MKKIKFTDNDRKLVIKELEAIQKTKLIQLKPSRKLYKDSNEMLYLISGGTEDWHGINKNVINKLIEYKKEGAFVVAKKYQTKIEICVGSLSTFVKNLDKLSKTKSGGYHFHNVITEDGLFVEEIPKLYCNNVKEFTFRPGTRDFSKLKEISNIINIEINDDVELTHSDVQAKLILIGSYLNFRTYTPDISKNSIYGNLGELCSDKEIPEGSIPALSLDSVKFVDVIWFDDEGYPTHAFEVEHTTDITKGLLRLYQIHKLRIKMFVISKEVSRNKFNREVSKNPFVKIKNEFIFKNYDELDSFFQSVKQFNKMQEMFLNKVI